MTEAILSATGGSIVTLILGAVVYAARRRSQEDAETSIERFAGSRLKLMFRAELAEFRGDLIKELNGTYIRRGECELREARLMDRMSEISREHHPGVD